MEGVSVMQDREYWMKVQPARTYFFDDHVLIAQLGETHEIFVHGSFPTKWRVLLVRQAIQPGRNHRHGRKHTRRSSP